MITKLDEQFFAQFKRPQHYKKGEIILRPQDEPTGVYYLKKGYVRLYLISPDGKDITFNIYKPGTYFSMMWALGDSPNIYFFESLTNVEVLKAPKDKVVAFLRSQPELLYTFIKRILIGLDGTTRLTQVLLTGSAYQKVASAILVLARRFGKKSQNGCVIINLNITHKLIASIASLSRESATIEILKLEKEKIIAQKNHKILVKNIEKLEKESAIPSVEQLTFQPFETK